MSLTVLSVLIIISGKFTESVALGESQFDQGYENKLTSKQSMPVALAWSVFCHMHNFQVTHFILGLLNYILFQCIFSYTWMMLIY